MRHHPPRFFGPLLFLLAFSIAEAAPARNEAIEERIRSELAAKHPNLVEAWRNATGALDRGDYESAVAGFRRVAEEAPEFAPAQRRLCGAYGAKDLKDEAIGACERAVKLDESHVNRIVLARALLQRGHQRDLERADTLATRALSATMVGSEEWAEAKGLGCEILWEKESSQAGPCVEDLLRKVPHDPIGNYLGVQTAVNREDWELANQRLEEARPYIAEETYQKVRETLVEATPLYVRYGFTALRILGAWLAGFVALFLLGLALSGATLLIARRLATARDDHASPLAYLLRGIYRLVLGGSAVFFYLSLPLLALVVLSFGGGLVYLFFALGRIPVKLIVIIVVLTGVTFFAIVKSIFVRIGDPDPGQKLDWARAPKLRKLLDEVALALDTRPVDNVYLTPTTDLAVLERGGFAKQITGRTERCLVLGIGILEGFEVLPFKSVLAHEYGHFTNRDTAGGNIALRVRPSLYHLGASLASSGAAGWYNPAWWFFRAFWAGFLRISQGASRLQEVLADRRAVWTYGSKAFQRGYTHVLRQSAQFDAHTQATLKQLIENKGRLRNLYRFTPAAAPSESDVEQRFQKEVSREPSAYDSHPIPADRLAWAAALDQPYSPRTGDDELMWSFFDDRERIEKEMTDVVRINVAENHNIMIRDEETPEAQEVLSDEPSPG